MASPDGKRGGFFSDWGFLIALALYVLYFLFVIYRTVARPPVLWLEFPPDPMVQWSDGSLYSGIALTAFGLIYVLFLRATRLHRSNNVMLVMTYLTVLVVGSAMFADTTAGKAIYHDRVLYRDVLFTGLDYKASRLDDATGVEVGCSKSVSRAGRMELSYIVRFRDGSSMDLAYKAPLWTSSPWYATVADWDRAVLARGGDKIFPADLDSYQHCISNFIPVEPDHRQIVEQVFLPPETVK